MAFKGAMMLSENDNVATCLEEVSKGMPVEVQLGEKTRVVTATEAIPFGFKVATSSIPKGSAVKKYGESIGIASEDIREGDLVHIHNLEGARDRGDLVKKESK